MFRLRIRKASVAIASFLASLVLAAAPAAHAAVDITLTPASKDFGSIDISSGGSLFFNFTVTNTGAGIPPSDQARIFDRFVQLDPARRESGSGLGLPIARWIAEAHGGTLTLDSGTVESTTFLIALPAPVIV